MYALLQPPLSRLAIFLAILITICNAATFNSTALILSIDAITSDQATYLLNGYGIEYDSVQFPASGQALPTLETSAGGNYGLIVSVGGVQHNGTSAVTTDQWNALYAYQTKYGVRMVHIDASPSSDFGVALVGGCCGDDVEQNLTMLADAQKNYFPTAGLRYET